MSFWDRFVLWVYLGLCDLRPAGTDAVARIFELAFQRGRLHPPALNDLSLLVLLAGLHGGSPLRAIVEAEVVQRGLPQQPQVVWGLLQQLRPVRLNELLEAARPPQTAIRILMANVILDPNIVIVGENLRMFLGRVLLQDPQGQSAQASQWVARAVTRYYRIPPGTIDFCALLYQLVLADLQQQAIPSHLPAGVPPAWWLALDPAEQHLLEQASANLPEPDVFLIALQAYARLDALQIAVAIQSINPTATADWVASRLESCWDVVL